MKIYDTNLCKFDCLAIKTCLLLYMYLNVEQVKTRPLGNDIGLGSVCFDFLSTNVVQLSISPKVAK